MPRLIHVSFFLLISLLSVPSVAQRLNQPAITVCENTYGSCVGELNATVTFQNCTENFKVCMDENAYMPSRKPLECFKSEAAWLSMHISIGSTLVIVAVAYGVLPALLKSIAKFINYTKVRCPKFGKCLLYMTDEDGDGMVTPRELLNPGILISTLSIAGFVSAWQDAVKVQAECDYAKEQRPQGD